MRAALALRVVGLEARTRFTYRVDFWINALVGFAAPFGLMVFLWTAMFRESGAERIGGYDLPGMLVYYAAVLLVAKIVRGPQFEQAVSQDIYEGGLNRYLVFPVPYLRFKYAQQLGMMAPLAVQVALFGLVLAFVLPAPEASAITPLTFAAALAATMVGNLLYFLMSWPIQAVAFWADNVWSLSVAQRLVTALLGGAMLPLTLFPAVARDVLAWLPFRFLFAWPVETLMGRTTPAAWLLDLGLALAWCTVIGLLGALVWRRGERSYSGIGM